MTALRADTATTQPEALDRLISAEQWDRLTDAERDWARRCVGSE